MGYTVGRPHEFDWITRPHDPGEPPRHVAELSDAMDFAHVRGNMWRYEPGAKGRRHRHTVQEETFVVLAGVLTMYVGEPATRIEVPAGGVVRVDPGTALQTVNHGEEELLVWAAGYPPESENAELLESAV